MSTTPFTSLPRPTTISGEFRSPASSRSGSPVKSIAPAEKITNDSGSHPHVERTESARSTVEDTTRLQRALTNLQEATTRVHYLMKLAHRNAETLTLAPPEPAGTDTPMKGLSSWTPSKTAHASHMLQGVEKILSVLARQLDSVWAWNETDIADTAANLERLSHQLERIK